MCNLLIKEEMRRLFIAIFACTALFSGCSKNDATSVKEEVKINFTVEGKAGFGADTKAVKTEWAVGDQILLLLEGAEGVLDYSQYNNTIMLTRTAAGWTADASKVSIDKLADGKGYYAVHHEGNLTISESSAGSMTYYYMENYPGGIELNASGTYSITGNVLDLGKITMNIRRGIFQVSIPDFSLTTDYAWMMAISLSGKYNQCGLAKGKAYIRHDKNIFNFLTGECSANKIRFFHLDEGSLVPSSWRIVVRAASATSRHVPLTFRNLIFISLRPPSGQIIFNGRRNSPSAWERR